jgi:hypothetical protein
MLKVDEGWRIPDSWGGSRVYIDIFSMEWNGKAVWMATNMSMIQKMISKRKNVNVSEKIKN